MLYAQQFQRRVKKAGANVFLINTGWVGGSYGTGKRIPIKFTRAMINAAIDGELDFVSYERDPYFNLNIPKFCPGVPQELLNPKSTWIDKDAYDQTAQKLVKMFQNNFKQYSNFQKQLSTLDLAELIASNFKIVFIKTWGSYFKQEPLFISIQIILL